MILISLSMISRCKVSDKAEKPQSPKVGILNVAQEVAFCLPKGHLLHAKRPCFAMRKTAYRQTADSQRLTEAAQTVMKELSRRHARTAETKRKGRANDVSARPLRRRKWSHRESNSDL